MYIYIAQDLPCTSLVGPLHAGDTFIHTNEYFPLTLTARAPTVVKSVLREYS